MSLQHTLQPLQSLQGSQSPQPLHSSFDDHVREFEWLRVVEHVLAERDCSDDTYLSQHLTQQELDDLVPSLDSLAISSSDDDFSFGEYMHFSPQKLAQISPLKATPEASPSSFRRHARGTRALKSESRRKPGAISPLEVKTDLNQRLRSPVGRTKIPAPKTRMTRSRARQAAIDAQKPLPAKPAASSPLQAFRHNIHNQHNAPLPKIQVFEDSSDDEEEAKERQQETQKALKGDEEEEGQNGQEQADSDSSVRKLGNPPTVAPPSPPSGFAANVTQPLRRSQRLVEAELNTEPPSPGRICSPMRRDVHLRPVLKVNANQGSSNKIITSLQSALSSNEALGFYSAHDLKTRLESKDSFLDGYRRITKLVTKKEPKKVQWADELEW